MSNWQHNMAGAIESVEVRVDDLKRRLGARLGCSGAPIILPFRSYGDANRLLVQGRVLENKWLVPGAAEDSIWKNLLSSYRRIESDEIPGARLGAQYGDVNVEIISDEEGYFRVWLEGVNVQAQDGWVPVSLQLLRTQGDQAPGARETAEVLVPSPGAHFGIISDIDDTVMQTFATELVRMARLTFLGNASTRLPFPGVAAFYRALHLGTGSANPLFYVSSGPWNLYDLLIDFFRLQDIPAGPMFLRDWGISRDDFLPWEHAHHKLEAIEALFEFYGKLPFILIGDSGQQDPEIYAEIVRRHGPRVLAVYVRDVSPATRRDAAINELAKEVVAAGSALILAEDTLIMAQHAAANGWVAETTIADIERDVRADAGRRSGRGR
ncbi:MAG TPA: phosphatase domain-containing protein [Candidatus Binatia bacterium]|nr:phosphatase domain-containing protein [Candidatus Binatia bacterium]